MTIKLYWDENAGETDVVISDGYYSYLDEGIERIDFLTDCIAELKSLLTDEIKNSGLSGPILEQLNPMAIEESNEMPAGMTVPEKKN